MAGFFNEILYRPIFNALIATYQFVAFHDLGLAIVFLTVALRFLLFPLFHATAKYQKLAPKLQLEIKKIQDQHRNNKEEQTKALLELYHNHKVNPFTPFLALIVQIPILFALYKVLGKVFSYQAEGLLYSFLVAPAVLNTKFLGAVDLSRPSIVIILVAAALQYLQAKISMPDHEAGTPLSSVERMGRSMAFIGPLITLIVLYKFPAALGLYWATFTAFSVFQQLIVNYRLRHDRGTYQAPKGAGGVDGLR
jgi:YidC/Oxa1 family membrane protein insertase